MSQQLIERIRKGREVRIEVGKFVFIALRPNDLEMLGVGALDNEGRVRRALGYVIGWHNVTEDDIVGGANMDPIKFDADLWREWSADHSEFWEPIARATYGAYTEHARREVEAAKNSQPG
jgi:hypothetical protein